MNSLVERVGSNVDVCTEDGDILGGRTLLMVDKFGVTITEELEADKAVFLPWGQIYCVSFPRSYPSLGEGIEQ